MQENKKKELIPCFPWAGSQPSLGKQGSVKCNHYLEKTKAITPNVPHFFFPVLYILSIMSYDMGYLWVSWGEQSLLCAFPTPCMPPAYSLVGQREQQKSNLRCVSTAQQMKTSPCYQPCFQSKSKRQSHTKQHTYKTIVNLLRKNAKFCPGRTWQLHVDFLGQKLESGGKAIIYWWWRSPSPMLKTWLKSFYKEMSLGCACHWLTDSGINH